jgi:addiction module HigA family antidote
MSDKETEITMLDPIHPGEVLREEFMVPLGLSARQLAHRLDVPPNRITAIVNGDRGVTADTALRLAHAFNTTPQFWLNLQAIYDLEKAGEHFEPTDVEPYIASCA